MAEMSKNRLLNSNLLQVFIAADGASALQPECPLCECVSRTSCEVASARHHQQQRGESRRLYYTYENHSQSRLESSGVQFKLVLAARDAFLSQ